MGIELPAELAGVAAQAGVQWPEADEDRMRQAAQAWRDAGTKLTNLTRDADNAARTALRSVEGQTGDAARRHWSAFVQPDTGHLTATARGCAAAADRLDHAAHQVGAAKVEIVRNLVALAQTTDAANQAASSGHPHALLNLDTAIRGTAANVSHITNNLATAVQPGSGVDMSGVQNLVNPNPGAHGGPLAPITETAHGVTTAVTDTARDVVDAAPGAPGNLVPPGTPGNLVPPGMPGDLVPPGGPGDLVPPGGPGDLVPPGAPGDLVPPGVPGDVVPPGGPGDLVPPGTLPPGVEPGNPDITGPVRVPPAGVEPGGVLPDAPTPPTGVPVGPGQTVQAGFAGAPVLDAPPPAPAAANPAAGALGGAPPAAGPVAGQAPGFAPAPGGGAPAGPPAGGGAAGPAPVPPPAGDAARGRGPQPVVGGAPAPAPAPPPLGDGSRAGAERARPAPGPLTTAVPPGPPPPPAAPAQPAVAPRERRDLSGVPFWVHMFPIGHMPVVSDRPARQLPAPPVEVDYAPGMRFEPGDHPEHHLVDSAQRLEELRAGVPALEPAGGLPADHPDVAVLAEGHDPLGGQHEREWDRRYLVRLGSVTAQGISNEGKEYAWPPGERYPEGGTAPGEPELLAEGTVIDRFGSPEGRVFSADGTVFSRRSLPPEALDVGYHRYRVTRPLPVWRTVSASWFGQPGGGERYRTTYSALELLALGYLAEITGGTH